MLNSDKKVSHLIDIPLRNTWWSRPQEYGWAAQFAGPDYVVLDAGCGISHPLKWYLGKTCKETWACDTDVRVIEKDSIIRETFDDLGEQAYKVVANDQSLWDDVTRIQSPVNTLDEKMPLFDRIFCISMFEDLSEPTREATLQAFSKHLKPDGLIVLTCDFPSVSLPHLFLSAKKAGLVPAGPVDVNIPKNALESGPLKIFRCVLKHDTKK
ncbi:MAG: class I SAM-dependent methyltransferase, partial [Parachlamydiaceae bacterium]|nr:class I SAM-dependent methyltransferase [Parachlamydiaceae bacterium]